MSPPDVRLRSARGHAVIAATVLGSGIAFLDSTVVNVALPALGRSLGASFSGLQWTIDGYLVSLSALILIGGAWGDRFGRRRVFVIGLLWFALASALCGFAPSVKFLIAMRVFQGAGAALLVPGSLAILRSSFSEEDQGPAVGLWAGLSGVTSAAGPLLGGWLVDALSWRAIFFINLPLTAGAVLLALRCVPEARDRRAERPDVGGALAALLGLGALTGGLIALPRAGARAPGPWASVAVGVAALLLFVLRERHFSSPMLPLELFRSRQFTGANLTTFAVYFALGGAVFLLVYYLQQVLGYSALAAGASMIPITVALLALSPISGRAAVKVGYRWPMTIGPGVAGAGLLLLGRVHPGSNYLGTVFPGVVILGLGLGVTVAPLTSAALSGAEPRYAGVASAVNNAVARTASLLAVALLPLVSGGATMQGFSRAMQVTSLLCLCAGATAFLTVRGRGQAHGQPG